MTAFDRACVKAFLARRAHGEDSHEYEQALDEMEILKLERAAERVTAAAEKLREG